MGAPGRTTDEEISAQLGINPSDDGGRRQWWLRGEPDELHELARSLGLVEVRRLHQMRRPLPVEPELTGDAAPLVVRAFDPAVDVDDWLDVNNRAFDFHPDQGGWTAATLRIRMSEPWFALDDFLVHDGPDGKLDGFCWTKVHAEDTPRIGEIYVIAAAPERHGTGLGRALVIAGLEHLWRQHATPIGMLYVEADNEPALRLYRRLGFAVHADDAAYEVPS